MIMNPQQQQVVGWLGIAGGEVARHAGGEVVVVAWLGGYWVVIRWLGGY